MIPSKEGYMFDPPSIEYVNVTSDIDEDSKDRDRAASQKAEEWLASTTDPAVVEGKAVVENRAEGNVGVVVRTGELAERKVALDVHVVTIDHSALAEMKFDWGSPKVKVGIGAELKEKIRDKESESTKWPWGIQIGRSVEEGFSVSLSGILDDLEKAGKANIVSSPEVSTLEGKTTEIKVTTEKYYLDNSGEDDVSDMEKIEYRTALNITPYVSPSGDILLTLGINASEVMIPIHGENSYIIARRVANDTVRIKDGGTVLVAGLKNDNGGAESSEDDGEGVVIFITGRVFALIQNEAFGEK
ncbi:MAG: type II and III secretion system protein [Planctomycetes bacterium]|nr:type II and III secretion system protein [Planctomycetota bacterium]